MKTVTTTTLLLRAVIAWIVTIYRNANFATNVWTPNVAITLTFCRIARMSVIASFVLIASGVKIASDAYLKEIKST